MNTPPYTPIRSAPALEMREQVREARQRTQSHTASARQHPAALPPVCIPHCTLSSYGTGRVPGGQAHTGWEKLSPPPGGPWPVEEVDSGLGLRMRKTRTELHTPRPKLWGWASLQNATRDARLARVPHMRPGSRADFISFFSFPVLLKAVGGHWEGGILGGELE